MASKEREKEIRARLRELGNTDADIDQKLSRLKSPSDVPPIPEPLIRGGPQVTTVPPLLNQLGQGLTFNLGEEAQAGFSALRGGDFQREQALRQRELTQTMENQPIASVAAQLGGGIATGIGAAKGVAQQFPKFAAANPFITTPVAGVTGGTVAGAAGAPEGQRGFGGAIGAGLGLGLGFAIPGAAITLPAIFSLSKSLGRRIVTPKAVLQAEKEARRIDDLAQKTAERFRKAFRVDETTAARVGRRVEQLGAGGTIAAAGGANVLSLAEGLVKQSGTARNRVARQTVVNNRKQAERLMAPLERNLAADGKSFTQTFNELDDTMRIASRPLYDDAMTVAIPRTPRLQEVLETTTGKRTFKDAVGRMGDDLNRGPLPENPTDELSMTFWHKFKLALDDKIDIETDSLTGKVSAKGRDIQLLKTELLDVLDGTDTVPGLNPTYKLAREAWGGPKASQDAMKLGARFVAQTQDPAVQTVLANEVKKLTKGQWKYFRIGAAQRIRNMVEASPDNINLVRKLWEVPQKRKILKSIFPAGPGFNQFKARALAEGQKFKAGQKLTQGSTTTPLAKEQRDIESIVSVALNEAAGRDLAAKATITQRLGQFVQERLISNEAAGAAGKAIVSENPEVVKDVLRRIALLETRASRIRAERLADPRAIAAGAVGGGVGGDITGQALQE